ncbi:AAA family ATPase [Candidatus Parcubacteria bacterium]|nr:MAG: AAA family ATPase [Candidatus Parcubacteria bacterium]
MIVGHETPITLLKDLADRNVLHHGYLFLGDEGIGKRTVALGLAHYLEYQKFEWEDCANTPLSDCMVYDGEGKSLPIAAVRAARKFLATHPARSPRRTIILNDANLLTDESQNTLLKITEDAPSSALIIFIAHHEDMIRPTLRSRLHRIYFTPPPQEAVARWLQETHHIPAQKAARIAAYALGKPGTASRLVTDDIFKKHFAAARAFLQKSPHSSFSAATIVKEEFFSFPQFLTALLFLVIAEKNYALWRPIITLRQKATSLNLNPRLQLESLRAACYNNLR